MICQENELVVTPDEFRAIQDLALDCEIYNLDGDNVFNEAEWIRGLGIILGLRRPQYYTRTKLIVDWNYGRKRMDSRTMDNLAPATPTGL